MENINKSFVMTAALPSSVSDLTLFNNGIKEISSFGYNTVEFYVESSISADVKQIISEYKMHTVFLAAGYQKKNQISLCSLNSKERRNAVIETEKLVETAIKCGCDTVLITSGIHPGVAYEMEAIHNLEKSIREILNDFPMINLTLEPGDTQIDAKQIIGSTYQAIELAKRFNIDNQRFFLTMDTSHLAQLQENAKESIYLAMPVCKHIHLANCILKENHPLYGDKHPLFGDKDAVYSMQQMQEFFSEFCENYKKPLTISVEIINRDSDEWKGFQTILNEERWFSEI